MSALEAVPGSSNYIAIRLTTSAASLEELKGYTFPGGLVIVNVAARGPSTAAGMGMGVSTFVSSPLSLALPSDISSYSSQSLSPIVVRRSRWDLHC